MRRCENRRPTCAGFTTGSAACYNNFLIVDDETRFSSPLENRHVFLRGLTRSLDALAGYKISIVEDIPEIGSKFGKDITSRFVRKAWLGPHRGKALALS